MNSYTQLFSLLISFGYGILIYYLNIFNKKIVCHKNIIIKVIINILYVFNMSMLYVVLLYYVNNGILHIYFVFFILLGYGYFCVKKCK